MEIKPGIYRHYRGNLYQVHKIVKNSEDWDGGGMVLYEALYDTSPDCKFIVRPAQMFLENVEWEGKIVPRFGLVENSNIELEQKRPKVGLGVVVVKDGKVLLGKRKNSHGNGTWGFPGGHLEFGESYEDCAIRETFEEVGIAIKNIRFITATNDIFKNEKKHYITIYLIADYDSGDVKNMEPEKLERWEWFVWDELPHPLFLPIQHLIKTGFRP